MTDNKVRRRTPGEQTEHGQGIRFDTLYDNDYVVGNKLTDEKRAELNKNAAEINEAYFDFITDVYQSGWGNKFHFSGYQPGESWATAAARHEHYLALIMEFKPGMKVLDLGCGVGGPAREIAIFAGVHVTGIAINDLHVERSNELNKEANLQDQVHMVKGSFSDLPFSDESFDMVFAIEALCCAPDTHRAYTEALRVLKPGGKIGILDWVITDKYDDSNADHRMIRGRIERNGAVPHMITPKTKVAALEKAGFEMVREEDRATAKANPIPWWHAIDYKHYPTWYDWSYCVRMTWPVYYASRAFINTLYFLRLIPQYGVTASYTVGECVYSCRDGGKSGIFSPMHMFVARKPETKTPCTCGARKDRG